MNTHELSSPPADVKRGFRLPVPLPAAARAFYAVMKRLDCGCLTFTSPEGFTSQFVGRRDGPHADLRFADWGVAAEVLRAAEIGLAECYRDGRVATSDLTAFLTLCALNQQALEKMFYGKPLIALLFRVKHLLRANTRQQARKNIHAHYDLSNDFYRLWLDDTMTYSAPVFDRRAGQSMQSMEAAQFAKYERMLARLDPKPGEHILEIGCGWGGFAEYAARTRDVRVTGITLSEAQLVFARERIRRSVLSHRVELQLIDYRDIGGCFDYIVSVEMFEAVGERFWPGYFEVVRERLKPGGRAMIQTITIDDALFPRYRATSDFIREYIFPGGMLAPVTRFVDIARRAGFETGEPFLFGADYADTLRYWLDRVNARAGDIQALGFDQKFLQLWRFYLCYCEAGFRTGRTNVMQIELTRPR